ncbi:MAG: deaminase domain-containing protein [Clostridium sp.]
MKKKRIQISTIEDLKLTLIANNYTMINSLAKTLSINFNISSEESHYIIESLESKHIFNSKSVKFTSENLENLIDYLLALREFNASLKLLYNKFFNITTIIINRIEYHRDPSPQENVDHIIKKLSNLNATIVGYLCPYELSIFDDMINDINMNYIYSKDIELLKNILSYNNHVIEAYNINTFIKEFKVNTPNEFSIHFIKAKYGSIEHYQHIKAALPRIYRLINNLDTYFKKCFSTIIINQSSTLLDSMNFAYATYNNHFFKASSGDVSINEYCSIPKLPKFSSSNVDRLGNVGTGYTRENDSEKKILEEIHLLIKNNIINSTGELILYTKWEPCQSCYYVISQFSELYPDINITIKYSQKYGK